MISTILRTPIRYTHLDNLQKVTRILEKEYNFFFFSPTSQTTKVINLVIQENLEYENGRKKNKNKPKTRNGI